MESVKKLPIQLSGECSGAVTRRDIDFQTQILVQLGFLRLVRPDQ